MSKPMYDRTLYRCFLSFLLILISGHAVIQAQQSESFVLPQRVGLSGETALSLDDAIQKVLENNNDVAISRIGREIGTLGLTAAKGAFDPRIALSASNQRQVTPVSSTLAGSANGSLTQRNATATPQVSGLIPWSGASYNLLFSSARQTSDNLFTTLNPQFPTSITFNLTQPLWRNLRYDDARNGIAVSRRNETLTVAQFRQRLLDTVTQAVSAYADLVFATENLGVQVDAVGLARAQVESNQRMVDQGVLAPIDVVEARTQLTTFEQNVYTAQEQLTRAENNLKALILANRTDPVWNTSLKPVTVLTLEAENVPLAEAVREALAARPEMTEVEISSEINELNLRLAREKAKPQVDLVAGYTASGLAGYPVVQGVNPLTAGFEPIIDQLNQLSTIDGLPPLSSNIFATGPVPAVFVGGYGQSLLNTLDRRFPTVQVGVNISLPLRNRTAEANIGSALAQGRQIQHQRDALEEMIEADVRGAMQSVESSRLRLGSAKETRDFAQQQYESEQRKFQSGTSTVFLVLQRQTTLVRARSLELQAETDLSKAIAELERATVRTFSIHGITVN